MPDSSTPLSDCISRYVEQASPENYQSFLRAFLSSQLGVILTGVPHGVSGKYVAAKNELAAAMSHTPDGKKMLLACADRAVFVQRFKHPFNAEIGALALLNMAMANPECDGITVNSAASEHTVVIPRTRIAALIAKTDEAKNV